jgi:hypothetical protein
MAPIWCSILTNPFTYPFFSYQTYDYCLNLIDPLYFIPSYLLFDPFKPSLSHKTFSLSQTLLSYFFFHRSFDLNFLSHLLFKSCPPSSLLLMVIIFKVLTSLCQHVHWLSLLPLPWPWPPYDLMMQLWGSHLYKPACKHLTPPKNYTRIYLLHPSSQLETKQNQKMFLHICQSTFELLFNHSHKLNHSPSPFLLP